VNVPVTLLILGTWYVWVLRREERYGNQEGDLGMRGSEGNEECEGLAYENR
jgi:hypothetical protein